MSSGLEAAGSTRPGRGGLELLDGLLGCVPSAAVFPGEDGRPVQRKKHLKLRNSRRVTKFTAEGT